MFTNWFGRETYRETYSVSSKNWCLPHHVLQAGKITGWEEWGIILWLESHFKFSLSVRNADLSVLLSGNQGFLLTWTAGPRILWSVGIKKTVIKWLSSLSPFSDMGPQSKFCKFIYYHLNPWHIPECRTCDKGLKLQEARFRLNIRKNFLTVRAVQQWNKLPQEVISAPKPKAWNSKLSNCNGQT